MNGENAPIVLGLLVVAACAIAYVFAMPMIVGQRRAAQRLRNVSASVTAAATRGVSVNRREQVAKTLNEIEAKSKNAKVSLELKLARAGLSWTKRTYSTVSAVLGLVVAFVVLSVTGQVLAGVGGAFAGGFGLPLWILKFLRKRRISKFVAELPNAVDVIVRGIKTGIPLGDCFRIVSREAAEPVRGEFRQVMEAQALGLSLGECATRLHDRVPVPEVNFFAIVINVQQQSGGNLSEALNNLSRVLRDRRKMAGKVQAMSMEAKASGAIIAALPFVVAGLTAMTSPDYISLLWTTDLGKLALAGSGVWMTIGVVIIRKMINFDF